MPDGQSELQMCRFAGLCWFVFNKVLATLPARRCVQCGYENHADVVGAINVLKRGQAILAAA